jgi:pSer/pThr/pTyr-binding forkhead associated (FHA) protein
VSGKLSYFIDWFPQKPVVLAPGKRYCIGRGGGNEFYLPDVRASREHAEIKWDGEAFVLTDLKSSNGTYLNGEPLTGSAALKEGDEIQVGEHVLRVRVEDATRVAEEYEETKKKVEEWQTVVEVNDGSEPARGGELSGAIEGMGLPQVIQMLEAGRKTGRLLVTATGVSGSIYFREGRVVAGEGRAPDNPDAAVDGAEAVYALLELERGVFEFLPEDVGARPRAAGPVIEGSTQALLMEGLRRLDERRLEEKRLSEGLGPEDTQKI